VFHITKKIIANKPIVREERPFEDRDDCMEAFWKHLNGLRSDEVTVVSFYGVGGIGKTALIAELRKQLASVHCDSISEVLNFSVEAHQTMENALIWLCKSLKKYIKFPLFELAYITYMQKVNPQFVLSTNSIPFLEEGDFLSQLILEIKAEDIPFVGFVPKLWNMSVKVKRIIERNISKKRLDELIALSELNNKELLESLPRCFAADLADFMEKNKPASPVVIFIDTYEDLWKSYTGKGIKCELDDWLHGDNKLIQRSPGVLWVIFGREKLIWDEKNSEWEGSLFPYRIEKLPEENAQSFLDQCGVNEKAIQDAIVQGSEGIPFYINLEVDTYNNIKRNEERTPHLEDFNTGKTREEVVKRFLHHVNREEQSILKLLSSLRYFDDKLFELLVKEFNIGYSIEFYPEFCKYSFISGHGTGTRELHKLMRAELQEHQDPGLYKRVHLFMYEYYKSKLSHIDIREITQEQKSALAEAFYHGKSSSKTTEEVKSFLQWFFEIVPKFYAGALWSDITPLHKELILFLESNKNFGPEHPDVAKVLNNLANLYSTQGKYGRALPLHNRALEIKEKVLKPEHPDVASSLNDLAVLYHDQDKYEDALSLYERALAIREKVLGPEHPNVADTLYNLAILYKNQENYEKALLLYERALAIREKVLGSEHADVASTLNNMANLYYAQRKYEDALLLYKKALSIIYHALGNKHPFFRTVLDNLILLYKKIGYDDKRIWEELNEFLLPILFKSQT